MIQLRPKQITAINDCRAAIASGKKRIILYSPTGTGKTEIAMGLIKLILEKSKKVLFVCNRINLIDQASRRFALSDISHGIVQGDNTCRTYEPVIIGSIQTIAKRGISEFDVIIIDEAHGAASDTYKKFITENKDKIIIGLTATPFSKLGQNCKDLEGALFQEIIIATTIQDAISDGFLVDIDVYTPDAPDMSGVDVNAGEYNQKQVFDAVDKPKLVGNIVKTWQKRALNIPTVVFSRNIVHSQHIVREFVENGIKAEHIDCYQPKKDMYASLARLEAGEIQVISCVGILREGWDFPACKCCILAWPTKSLIKLIQEVGRVIRPSGDNANAIILDHSGTIEDFLKQGIYPTDDLPLFLDTGKDKKHSAKKERKPKERKACPECSYVKPIGINKCPICSFVPTPQSDVVSEEGELFKLERGKKGFKSDKQQVYSELISMAEEKGYKPGWAVYKYKDIFGILPKGLFAIPKPASQEVRNHILYLQIKYAASKKKSAFHAKVLAI